MRYSPFKSAFLATTLTTGLLACSTNPTPSSSPNATNTKFVAITQIVEHPALDATREGVKAELAAAGLIVGKNLKLEWQSAQGSPATAAQIASKFVGERPDVIVAIATASAQAVAATTKEIPLIFSAVTDPLGAKLVPNLEKPGGTITGVSALTPIARHLDLIAQITPQAKRIGVLYNAGEPNSLTLLKLLKTEAPKRGMTLVEATVSRSSEVATAARSLVGKVDAVYIPTDNTVVSALESAIQVSIENKLPLYAADTDSVQRGAMAALGYNYYEVGRQTGKLVLQVLNGQKPGDLPVESAKRIELYINLRSAQAMGVTVPDQVQKKADKVFN